MFDNYYFLIIRINSLGHYTYLILSLLGGFSGIKSELSVEI